VLESPRLDEEEREALADARLAGDRTLRLVANLLDVARSNAGRLELKRGPHQLSTVVAAVAERYRRVSEPRGIRIELAVSPELSVPIDAELVTRVVENIFDNSLRYTPAGGRVRVDAERGETHVRLRIGNSGPPIPAELRQKIFEKYAQADSTVRGHVGLGLHFCALAVEAHGGRLVASEDEGLPTVFVITLPMKEAEGETSG
jgi:signal transduction histidine kinase